MDQYGEVVSCKMHDLMHEVAEEVAGKEICVGTSITSALERRSRHLFHLGSKCTHNSFTNMKIRSYLRTKWACKFPLHSLIANWMSSLRTLDLHNLNIKELPDSMGKLLHLRYLDLSNNSLIRRLPNSVTRLCNLQTLKLVGCCRIKELPKDFKKLVKLRHLDIADCKRLTLMPSGFDELTGLRVLTAFLVANESSARKQNFGQLEDLKALVNLKGCIRITVQVPEDFINVSVNDKKGKYLRGLKQLKTVCISFQLGGVEADTNLVTYHESLLKEMQPHSNIKGLILNGYQGAVIPRWGSADDNWTTFFPNLVKIEITNCKGLQHLPSLSTLASLKSLLLYGLINLEYIENASDSSSSSSDSDPGFFPSLEELNLETLPKLKGWWNNRQQSPSFPHLLRLLIRWCPSLATFPTCPSVEKLCLTGLNESLDPTIKTWSEFNNINNSHALNLREVEIDNLNYLKSVPKKHLTDIKICSDEKLTNLSEHEDVLKSCSAAQSLTIFNCQRLRSISGGLEHLTALQSLSIWRNPNLRFSEEVSDGMPWKSLRQNLCSFEFKELEKLVNLPEGMKHLSTLRNLTIDSCWNLEALPEWISCLPSLEVVQIKSCYLLKSVLEETETCQASQKGLPKIHHIPSVSIVHD